MPCYHPIPAIRVSKGMQLHPKHEEPTHWLPCSRCLGCREQQQQTLAIRLIHESRYYRDKTFLTLTYDEANEPKGLQKRELQLFWKRLRKSIATNSKGAEPLKYLACGEYGDRTKRPHYHAAVLGLEIQDGKRWDSENDRSAWLEEIWGKGIVTNSELTPERIRYTAGYVLKKAGYRKQTYCDEDGVELEGPFRVMSQVLGKQWVQEYASDLRNGYLLHEGARYSIPRYYLDKVKTENEKVKTQIETSKLKDHLKREKPERDRLKAAEVIREKTIRERLRSQV